MDGVLAVERRRRLLVGRVPDQREGIALTLGHREVGHRAQVLALDLDPVPQRDASRGPP